MNWGRYEMMKKILVIVVIVAAVIASVGMFMGGIIREEPSVPASTPTITPSPKTTHATPSHEQSPIPLPKGGEYLYFRGGEETKVFLINSNMSYGIYDENISLGRINYLAKKGDPCVIINGTIRNEYDKDYFICLMADIYNTKGENVGTVISPHAAQPGFTVTHPKSKGISPFEIHVKYDKRDIIDYDVFVAFEPQELPPP